MRDQFRSLLLACLLHRAARVEAVKEIGLTKVERKVLRAERETVISFSTIGILEGQEITEKKL